MDDALLVSRATGGDLGSFGQLYDRYFNRVYDFCWRILRDADGAAEAAQEVFATGISDLPGLSRAPSFKSWLLTIAHNIAVSRAERAGHASLPTAPSHEEAFGMFGVPDPSRVEDPVLIAGDDELPDLVWEAVTALRPRDYALLDLHVRQGLEGAEIAGVLDLSKGNAKTVGSRMKQAAGDIIASHILARRGTRDCGELQRVLAESGFPPLTDEVRRAIDAHVADCQTCARSRKAIGAPLEVFASFAAVPAAFSLKGDVWRDLSSAWPYADRDAGTARESGMGVSDDPFGAALAAAGGGGIDDVRVSLAMGGDGAGNRIVMFAVAVLGLLVLAFAIAGGVILASSAGGDGDDSAAGAASATAAASTPGVPGVVVETPTIDLTASATPTPEEDTPTPPATPEEAEPTEAPATDTPEAEPTETPAPNAPAPTRTPSGLSALPTAVRTPTP